LAVVLFDYVPQRDDELALRRGQRLTVLDKSSDGWWKGEEEESGSKGWFPSNYVREEAANENTEQQQQGNGLAKMLNGADQQPKAPSPRRVLEV
jgi:uncharacterized protein YgiM (DUF1202 family)